MDRLKYILFFLILASCKVKDVQRTEITSNNSDSTHVRETIEREKKLVITSADSAAIRATVDCPDLPPITETQGRATVTAGIKDGKLNAKCKCDTSAIAYEVENRLREEYREKQSAKAHTEYREVTKEVPYIPKFFWIMTVVGIVLTIYEGYKLIFFYR